MNCTEILMAKDKMEEECGVFGIYSKEVNEVAQITYYGLYALQHRGQESAGISVSNFGEIVTYKGMGLTADVFTPETLNNLVGNAAIGHVRYSTTGASKLENAQPLESRYKLGQIAVAHNGNLTNAKIIRELLEDAGSTFNTSIDSEVIIKMIARKANGNVEDAIRSTVGAIKGAYALVILAGNKLVGVRDPYGIRPLCLGINENGDYILASESCAIDAVGGTLIRDVLPGEMVIIDENGVKSVKYSENNKKAPCSFEHIYFARPDSVIDGLNVYESRVEAGRLLAKQMKVEADVVIGVPDSGIPAAIGFAEASGIPYAIGLVKNKYIGRTFIKPTQALREQAVMVKLNPLKVNLEGKRVVIIDDSLVRGTTSKILIEIIRRAGAKEVHFRSASPAVKHSCYFGIDTAHREELIAARLSVEEIRKEINADTLDYLSMENMLKSLKGCDYCVGCFNGEYPVDTPTEE
ncbi:amidophosphoribosyltransferase [Fusobacterium mortiferum]|uniref:Amidophosphoribosyltransferase n=1 Tax=Fusobacterium mortiferum ATCC 9817 TaxID=469616 RepID=A0ABN5JFY0_FUSMR|nr:amidophosphoribosyltransferase [Fusobacterium mortiferum]AVQ20119.1 amidophosphoribosyltransferase [Fusobacterium mortiferum ATCC 9817]EEO35901.2 amidophosphoribosyltransferase [Fusobacterium mortiferum ATCC 9817]MCF2627019.1 amidophosphoribosyltransferase [Fusobacterium mortiferum]MCF2698357.1 amidophosphoribosyltransferase [Fusobacterium mortiferum]MCI7188628.1 amidophosphoribosyltransferase [Fusobacterium mortiferum]